jgi:hypothetical protein
MAIPPWPTKAKSADRVNARDESFKLPPAGGMKT